MADKILATVEPGVWQEMLGYLNFSSGSPDCRFLRNLNELGRPYRGGRHAARRIGRRAP